MGQFEETCKKKSVSESLWEDLRKAILEDEKTKLELKQAKLQAAIKSAEAINEFADKCLDRSKQAVEKLKTKLHEATPEELREGFEAAFINRGGFKCDHKSTLLDKVDAAEKRLNAINLLKSEGYKVLKPITKYKPV
jgi:hypothetical protein